MKLQKTVVGSFPLKEPPIEKAIEQIIDIQLKHKIDVVSDGEQRSDMLGYFESIPGLERSQRGIFVSSKISALDDPKNFVKLKDLHFVMKLLEEKSRIDTHVKVTITGPITLGFFCGVNGLKYYSNLRDLHLYSDFADALSPLILEIAKNNCYIQIDEPSLSSRVINPEDAVKIINRSFRELPSFLYDKGRLVLHACGALNEPLLKEMVKLDVPTLSLAFSATNVQKNIQVISKQLLQSGEKKLGAGCISVQAASKGDVEKVEVVTRRLRSIIEKVGEEQIEFAHPDCGLRNTNPEAVELILERMNSATKHIIE